MCRIGIIALFLMLNSSICYAYMGPGAGGGIIAATLGILVAVFVFIFAIVWFPIKRLLNRKKENKDQENSLTKKND